MAANERVIAAALLHDLPETAATVLREFVAALIESIGSDLQSVVLFGSGAEGRLEPTSDLNVLVVAARLTIPQLDAVRPSLLEGRSAAGLTAMFLESAELERAAESFALKFSDIKARHRLLYGDSPFEAMEVTREARLRRVQQVLLNLTLRLRERYAIDGDREERLAWFLADAAGPIRASTATLISLRDGRAVAPHLALEEFLADAAWRDCLRDFSAVHRGERLPAGATRGLFGEVLRLLGALGNAARTVS